MRSVFQANDRGFASELDAAWFLAERFLSRADLDHTHEVVDRVRRAVDSAEGATTNETFRRHGEVLAVLHDVGESEHWGAASDAERSLALSWFPNAVLFGLVAVTRYANEVYADYIERVYRDELAREVKRRDLQVNKERTLRERDALGSGFQRSSLLERYNRALNYFSVGDVRRGGSCAYCGESGHGFFRCPARRSVHDLGDAAGGHQVDCTGAGYEPCDRLGVPCSSEWAARMEMGVFLFRCSGCGRIFGSHQEGRMNHA